MPLTARQHKAVDIILDAFVELESDRDDLTDKAIVAVQNLTEADLLLAVD